MCVPATDLALLLAHLLHLHLQDVTDQVLRSRASDRHGMDGPVARLDVKPGRDLDDHLGLPRYTRGEYCGATGAARSPMKSDMKQSQVPRGTQRGSRRRERQ